MKTTLWSHSGARLDLRVVAPPLIAACVNETVSVGEQQGLRSHMGMQSVRKII
jgi:hypothetical protein